jgi:hypothetical protein
MEAEPALEVAVTPKGEGDPLGSNVAVREGDGETLHDVAGARVDFERLSREERSPEQFVRRCFQCLLKREPKASILTRFDVSVIGSYSPEFQT